MRVGFPLAGFQGLPVIASPCNEHYAMKNQRAVYEPDEHNSHRK